MIDAETQALIRTLRDALMEARPFVELEANLANTGMGAPGHGKAPTVLDLLDDAVVQADEVLS